MRDAIANVEATVAVDAAVLDELGNANVVVARRVAPDLVDRGADACVLQIRRGQPIPVHLIQAGLEGLRKLLQVERAVAIRVELLEGRGGLPLPQGFRPTRALLASGQRGGSAVARGSGR